jgi:hypothetical protein
MKNLPGAIFIHPVVLLSEDEIFVIDQCIAAIEV